MNHNIKNKSGALLYLASLMMILLWSLSCSTPNKKAPAPAVPDGGIAPNQLFINYPKDGSLFPVDFQAPTIRWTDTYSNHNHWSISISDSLGITLLEESISQTEWKPDSPDWEVLKQEHLAESLRLSIRGYSGSGTNTAECSSVFKISQDSVDADIFFRAVTLPFSYAVENVHTIEWYMGSVQGGSPRKMLDNMQVCANCHSFSPNGPILAMDVDYGNDKGSYVVTHVQETTSLIPEDIITWSNFKKDEGDPTFGLLSQISPSGKYVLSTVKDLSVFAAVDDNLAYSQLFFPIKGIIGIYDVASKKFSELQGANDPRYVQSNPVWSPDNKTVLFSRTEAHINEKVRQSGTALLNINDIKEFKDRTLEFKFDIYAVDFNAGRGGTPRPLADASSNGQSNYFPKYSPDGKWIVFCQADNFMLLQPDSKLYIMRSDGTGARLMNCNTDNMNSWHSWSPNGRWLVFSSKEESLYTRLYLTHIDENGNDSPPILLENMVFENRAANIPEFFPGKANDFMTIKDDFSNSAPYLTAIATDNIKSHYYLRADSNLRKALALDPSYIDAYIARILLNSILQQVNSKEEREDKKKALSAVNQLIAKDRSNEEARFLKANLLTSVGEYDQAATLLRSIISGSPEPYRAYELLATVYKKKGRPEQVISCYDKMKELVPANELEINLSVANYYVSNDQTDQALSLLKSLAEKYPDSEEIQKYLCSIYMGNQDLGAAQKAIDFLLAYDSMDYNYYFMYSQIAEMSGNTGKAREYEDQGYVWLQKELEDNTQNIPLLFEKAAILQKNHDIDGAIEIYNTVLKALPSNYQALKEKARLMLITQKWQHAILMYQELIKFYTPEEEFFNNSAIAYINTGNYTEALQSFNGALGLNPVNLDALYNRSRLHRMLGDAQKADKDLESIRGILSARENLTADERQLLQMISGQ